MSELQPNKLRAGECKAEAGFTREELHIYVILYAVFAAGLSSYGRTTLNLPATDRATTLRSYMASP